MERLGNAPTEQDLSPEPHGPAVRARSLNHTKVTEEQETPADCRLSPQNHAGMAFWEKAWSSRQHLTEAHRLQSALHRCGRRGQLPCRAGPVTLRDAPSRVVCPPFKAVVLPVSGGGVASQGTFSNV